MLLMYIALNQVGEKYEKNSQTISYNINILANARLADLFINTVAFYVYVETLHETFFTIKVDY